MFNIAYTLLVQWLIPVWLRQPFLVLLSLSSNYPLREGYNSFLNYRTKTLYTLAHNSQVCSMRGMLNDAFDRVQRKIVIEDYNFANTIFLYEDIENLDTIIDDNDPLYLDADDAGVDFVVVLPRGLFTKQTIQAEMARMRALINFYKLAGKQYVIV